MAGLLVLSRIVDRINELIGRYVSWAIFLAVVVSAANAVMRKGFSMSSNAWLELQWYLFGAAFMLAAAYTLKQNEHIRVDVVYGLLSRRTQHWIDLLGHVFFLLPFTLLMAYYFVPYVWVSFRGGEMSTNAGGLILWPAKALLLFGFVLLFLQGISELIKRASVLFFGHEDMTPLHANHPAAEEMDTLAPATPQGGAEPGRTDGGPAR